MTRLAISMSSGCASRAPTRAPASACALDRVRMMARVAKRFSQGVRLEEREHALGVEGETACGVERNFDHFGALDARGNAVHAEGRRALQDGIDAGAQV